MCELDERNICAGAVSSIYNLHSPPFLILAAGDLVTFSKLRVHYSTHYSLDTELFTRESRTAQVQALYQAARDRGEPEVRIVH